MQNIINQYINNKGIKHSLKIIFNKVFRYAEKYDLITKDYSKFIDLGKSAETTQRKIYSKTEIENLWKIQEHECVKITLIMLYTGMRIGEIRTLKKKYIYQ